MAEMEQALDKEKIPKFESMPFGMILDRAINLYIKNFVLLLGIMVVPRALNYVNGIVFSQSMSWSASIATGLYLPVYIMINLLTFAIGTGAATIAISSRYLGQEISVVQAYRDAFRKLGPILGAWVVAGILILLGFLAAVFIGIILTIPLGMIIPEILFIMPLLIFAAIIFGIILAISYSLITPAIMLENLSAKKSRKRSRKLTKGCRWQTLGLFVIYLIVYVTLFFGSTYLVNRLTCVEQPVFTSVSSTYLHHLVTAPLGIVLSPISAILIVLIYYNQRIRKEGFDLVLLAEALAQE